MEIFYSDVLIGNVLLQLSNIPLRFRPQSLAYALFPTVLRTRKTCTSGRADYDPLTAAERTATKAPLEGRRTGKRGHDLLSLLPALKCQFETRQAITAASK